MDRVQVKVVGRMLCLSGASDMPMRDRSQVELKALPDGMHASLCRFYVGFNDSSRRRGVFSFGYANARIYKLILERSQVREREIGSVLGSLVSIAQY